MLERDIVSAIMKYLKALPACFAYKEHGGMYGTAGVPDIICCVQGRFIAFEVKTPTGRLTVLQQKTMEKIQLAGGCAYKVTSAGEVREILASLGLEGEK